ncbi:MAG: F0F1 ATP synthase subunit gamma [Actinomycetota bacterium]
MGAKVRDIRRRIRSVRSTQQITRAMELIAASRIVRAQSRALRARPFAQAIGEMLEMVAGEARGSPLLEEREVATTGLVVVTSDRGLCGAYNANVLREAERLRRREAEAGHAVAITAVGKKAISYFRFRKVPMTAQFMGVSDTPRYGDARRIAEGVIRAYGDKQVDRVVIAYTDFVSTFLQRARVTQILPVPRPRSGAGAGPPGEGAPRALFDFEPEPAELLRGLLPRYMEVKLFAALLESSASEHAARRRAMKNATDNADDLLRDLTRDVNRARQAEITSELADLVGAAEALRGSGGDEGTRGAGSPLAGAARWHGDAEALAGARATEAMRGKV